MPSLRRLVVTGTLLTTIGMSGAYYISNADAIQNRVNTLFNLADGYKKLAGQNQATANEKQAILDGLATYLGISTTDLDSLTKAIEDKLATKTDDTTQSILNTIADKLGLTGKDNYTMADVKDEITHLQTNDQELKDVLAYLDITNWDGTSESIETAIVNKVNQAMADREQSIMNEIAWDFLGLAKTNDSGETINYTKAQVMNEIVSVLDEINAVEQYIDDYNAYNNPNMDKYYDYNEDGKITLLEKIQSMIDQLNQAQEDSVANLKLVEQNIVNLGHCPVHATALDGNYCASCGKNYTKTTTGNESTEPDKGITGGTTGGTTQQPTQPTQPSQPTTPQATEHEKAIAQAIVNSNAVVDLEQCKVETTGSYEGDYAVYFKPSENSTDSYSTTKSNFDTYMKNEGYTRKITGALSSKEFQSGNGTGWARAYFDEEVNFDRLHQYVTYLYNQQ